MSKGLHPLLLSELLCALEAIATRPFEDAGSWRAAVTTSKRISTSSRSDSPLPPQREPAGRSERFELDEETARQQCADAKAVTAAKDAAAADKWLGTARVGSLLWCAGWAKSLGFTR